MQENGFEYRPYWSETHVVPLFKIFESLGFIMAGFMLHEGAWLFFVFLFVFSLACTCLDYLISLRWSHTRVYAKQDGVHVITYRLGEQFIPWEKLSYGYYIRNFKGFLYVFLTNTPLQENQRRKIFKKAMNRHQIVREDCIVLPLDRLKKSDYITDYLKQHVEFLNQK